jgi:hypothetical protein
VVLSPDYAQHGAQASSGPMPHRVQVCAVVPYCVSPLSGHVMVRTCDGRKEHCVYPAAALRHAPPCCVVCGTEEAEEDAMLSCSGGGDNPGSPRHRTCVACVAAAVRARAGDPAALRRHGAVFRCAAPHGCDAAPHAHAAITKKFVLECAPDEGDDALAALARAVERAAALAAKRNLGAELAAVAAVAAAAAAAAEDA